MYNMLGDLERITLKQIYNFLMIDILHSTPVKPILLIDDNNTASPHPPNPKYPP